MNLTLSDQMKVALVRAAYTGAVAGLLVGLEAYQQTHKVSTAVLAGGVAALTVLAGRGGVEGHVDTQRAKPTVVP